jgi:hypothetical protein
MLAASLHGRMESVMEAHGATIGTLRGLVRMGLAAADRRPAHFNPGAIVTVLQITEAGRNAIAERKSPVRGACGNGVKGLLLDDVVLKHPGCPNGKFDATQSVVPT